MALSRVWPSSSSTSRRRSFDKDRKNAAAFGLTVTGIASCRVEGVAIRFILPLATVTLSLVLSALAALTVCFPPCAFPQWELVVLGIAQDAGIPHLGCEKGVCSDIKAGKRKPEKVACLGLRERASGAAYLFDATPDVRQQLIALNGGQRPSGVFLTHAHMGHYSGLLYFGRESVDWKGVPVYGSARMGAFLSSNDPWRFLISNGNLAFRRLDPDRGVSLPGGVKVTAFRVPHRDEFTDTFGYLIEGPSRKALFIPDIDRWEKWAEPANPGRPLILEYAARADLLFLDGTFSSPEEVGARDIAQIPHPMMPATRELLAGIARPAGAKQKKGEAKRAELWFIHLNHTNTALVMDRDVAREGMVFRL